MSSVCCKMLEPLPRDSPEVSHFFDVPGWERRLAWDTQGARSLGKKQGAERKKYEEWKVTTSWELVYCLLAINAYRFSLALLQLITNSGWMLGISSPMHIAGIDVPCGTCFKSRNIHDKKCVRILVRIPFLIVWQSLIPSFVFNIFVLFVSPFQSGLCGLDL